MSNKLKVLKTPKEKKAMMTVMKIAMMMLRVIKLKKRVLRAKMTMKVVVSLESKSMSQVRIVRRRRKKVQKKHRKMENSIS